MWEARNDLVHRKTVTEKQEQKQAEIVQKIRRIYENKDKYLPLERRLLGDDVEEFIKTKGYTALANWERVWGTTVCKECGRLPPLRSSGSQPHSNIFQACCPSRVPGAWVG